MPPAAPDARLQLFAGNIPAASSSPTAPVASDSDAHLYFLLARNKHIPKRERLVLWLNGGPGCSSFDGSLVELGPVRVNEDETLRVVEGTAWNEYANVLFCEYKAASTSRSTATEASARGHLQWISPQERDIPTQVVPETLAGTLFEAGADLPDRGQVTKNDDVHELDTAAQQVVNFLANFYRIFPEFATMDVGRFLAGEFFLSSRH